MRGDDGGYARPGSAPCEARCGIRAPGIAHGRHRSYTRRVPDAGIPLALWILFGANTLLLLLVWLGQIGQGARMRRIERDLEMIMTGNASSAPPGLSGPSDFERWLMDDAARRSMPKKEQFAAYRRWRAEQGLTWNAPSGDR